MDENRCWIETNRKELERQFPNKVIIVCNQKVVRVLDVPVSVMLINDLADEICLEKPWDYAYLSTARHLL